jgi:Protein of unknown function (DUF3047)
MSLHIQLSLLGLVFLSVISVVSLASQLVSIEDWKDDVIGTIGIPKGWTGQGWGFPDYNMTIVVDEGRRALHLKSKDDSSTINKEIEGRVDLRVTPILEWQWKAVELPLGGDSREEDKLDQVAQLYVSWPRFPRAFRSRIIGYVWDTTAPVGTQVQSSKTSMVTYIVVRSGDAKLGQWITERRNVREDYRMIFDEEPSELGYISLSIDSNDTDSRAEAFIGPILFRGQ